MPDHHLLVGTPLERIEDARFLTGRGRYVDDLHLPGMLHAAIVRCPIAHGRLDAIDVDAARALPGVHAVFTAADIARVQGTVPHVTIRAIRIPELVGYEQPVLAHDVVRYVGEPLAIVVADSPALAEDAADAVSATIAPLDPRATRPAITYTATKGDARACRGDYVRKETFSIQRHAGFPLETRGLVATWDGAHLTVYGAAKVPFFVRRTLAALMELPNEAVDMIEVDVGGSFGMRGEFYPEDFLVPFAARALGRPVKWIEDRRESLLGSNHSRETRFELEIVCTRAGRVLALRGRATVDAGAYVRGAGVIPTRFAALLLSGPYDIGNVWVETTHMLTHKTPVGTFRGPGMFEADFFRERLFDIAARELGIDPVEFRRMNLVRSSQMPYQLVTLDRPPETDYLDSGDYALTLDRCLQSFGWEAKRALQGRLIDGRYHGIAIGCFIDGGAGGMREFARIETEAGGCVAVYVGSAAVGQGLATILTQIAADALGVPPGRVRILHGSTTYLKEGVGSGWSRATVMGGSVIVRAAEALKAALRERAASLWKCPPDEVVIDPGLRARAGERRLDAPAGLAVEAEFENPHHTYAYGAAAAHVTVDARTGKVDLLDYLTVEDLGRVINPLTARGQAIGAVAQGLGGVFLEHLKYDDAGQLLAASFADYLMPTAAEFPSIRAEAIAHARAPHNPLGAKGGGEGGIIAVGGVVANAVAAALGAAPNTLPLTPEAVWQLAQQK